MREHQITITLQAEQFQEIQRLARTAGARSVGTYAREKLLAAVGLNLGSKNLKATRAQDLTSVTGELKRLHRELQIFIAESLSAKDYGYVVNGPQPSEQGHGTTSSTSQSSPKQEPPSSDNQPARLQDYGQSAKEAEELAERAFIISPRLGAIEEVSDEPMDFSDPLDELLGEYDETSTPLAASSLLSALEGEHAQEEKANDYAVSNDIQKNEERSTSVSGGEIPHSVFDAELAAFQKEKERALQTEADETREEPVAPVSTTTSAAEEEEEEGGAKPAEEQIKPDENVNTGAQTGIQEEGSEVDFQNRPPLSGGPPPRKRRT